MRSQTSSSRGRLSDDPGPTIPVRPRAGRASTDRRPRSDRAAIGRRPRLWRDDARAVESPSWASRRAGGRHRRGIGPRSRRRLGRGDNHEESSGLMQGQTRRAYKEITLQQLRSFCETVRLGSLTAAADSLGIARPTVWKQVHALEDYLGMQLVEPHARGCQPTDAGLLLADLVIPLVTGIGSLRQALQSGGQVHDTQLTVAASSRLLVERPAALRRRVRAAIPAYPAGAPRGHRRPRRGPGRLDAGRPGPVRRRQGRR